jgi:hypothetical protein
MFPDMGRSVLLMSHGFPTLKLVPMWDVGNVWKHGNVHFFLWAIWDVGNMWKYGNMGSHLGICVPKKG